MINTNAKIYIAGHQGMVGSAIVRQLSKDSDVTLLLASRGQLDLRDSGLANASLDGTHTMGNLYVDVPTPACRCG